MPMISSAKEAKAENRRSHHDNERTRRLSQESREITAEQARENR